MKITIIGAGTVGTATGDGFSRFGHDVTFHDIDPDKMDKLKTDGLNVARDPSKGNPDIIFVTTPENAAEEVVRKLPVRRTLTVIRSSVPPGTTKRLREETSGHIAVNPEFLREATALQDFLSPDRIVYSSCCPVHREVLEELYRPLRAPMVHVDNPTEAEMVKYASNLFLATTISYWNEIAAVCRRLGVNSHSVGKVAAMDPRIPSYGASRHGEPFGGKCFPSNIEAFLSLCRDLDYTPTLFMAMRSVNEDIRRTKDAR